MKAMAMKNIHTIGLFVVGIVVVAMQIAMIDAASSGKVGTCDAHDNFGCATWKDGNRLDCTEVGHGYMEWVARPVRTDTYTVRTADTPLTPANVAADPKKYVPGQVLSIFIRTHDYNGKFRGLLMHAVDTLNNTVGTWELPDAENAIFWSPSVCPQAVLHNDAEPKPFLNEIRFRAPPAGTGTIVFRTLIKVGPANTGYFYYPNKNYGGDLTLEEAPTAGASASAEDKEIESALRTWHISNVSQSCSQVCATKGEEYSCDLSAMKSIKSADVMQSQIGSVHACAFPLLSDCSSVSPTMSTTGTCYFHSDTCEGGQNAKSQAAKETDCDTTGMAGSNGRRLCACTTTSAASSRARGPGFALNTVVLFALAFVTHGGGRNSSMRSSILLITLMTLFVLLVQQPTVQAHNWMHTPSRARKEASTLKPCRGRKGSDTHAQVGPGQSFVMKWATGHASKSYITVIHEDNVQFMRFANFTAMVEDYIKSAPAEANVALVGSKQRYHGTNKISDLSYYDGQVADANGMYKRKVPDTDKDFLTHEFEPTLALYQYEQKFIAGDSRVAYRSAKYPWLEAAYTYEQLYHLPADYDAVAIEIPAHSKAGHYVVGWKWRGYYDCADVDKFDFQVENIYGKDNKQFTYNKIDHCQFINPRKVSTKCLKMDGKIGADACKKAMDNMYRYGNNKNRNDILDGLALGVAIVPLKNNPKVAFPNENNIPWHNSTCANSDWTLIKPDIAGSGGNGGAFTVANNGATSYTITPALSTMVKGKTYTFNVQAGGHPFWLLNKPGDLNSKISGSSIQNNGISSGTITYTVPMDYSESKVYYVCQYHPNMAGSFSVQASAPSVNQVTTTPISWNTWKKTTKNGKKCTNVMTTLTAATLREAVSLCTKAACAGISWEKTANTNDMFDASKTAKYLLCDKTTTDPSDTPLTTDASFNTYLKKLVTISLTSSKVININFQQTNSNGQVSNLPAGWYNDEGDLYGDRGNGQEYGWRNCKPTVGRNSAVKPATINSTYLTNIQRQCSNGKVRSWELKVPNGVYKVMTQHDRARVQSNSLTVRGCSVENVRVTSRSRISEPAFLYNKVEVLDGKLTLFADFRSSVVSPRPTVYGDGCNILSALSVERIADRLDDAWLPVSQDPWWQQDLGKSTAVGLVTITVPGATGDGKDDCRSWWLYKGNRCASPAWVDPTTGTSVDKVPYTQNQVRELGWFDTSGTRAGKEGAIVSVSDTKCTGTSCPGGTVCSTVTKVTVCSNTARICPMHVDCHGATGRYLRIQLPGNDRIIEFNSVQVNKAHPEGDENTMVCYGVEARTRTETDPEYVISEDPEDPIFYSTCYIRNKNITFLPTGEPEKVVKPRWHFNGQCLDCENFHESLLGFNYSLYGAHRWKFDSNGQCVDCSSFVASTSQLGDSLGVTQTPWPLGVGIYTPPTWLEKFLATQNGKIVAFSGGALILASLFAVVARYGPKGRGRKNGKPLHYMEGRSSNLSEDFALELTAPDSSTPTRALPAIPDLGGWSRALDEESGETYYYNQKTGETSWDPPSQFESDHV
jgi:hypothetical protein